MLIKNLSKKYVHVLKTVNGINGVNGQAVNAVLKKSVPEHKSQVTNSENLVLELLLNVMIVLLVLLIVHGKTGPLGLNAHVVSCQLLLVT